MYGERARIGLVTPATDSGVLPEHARLMPAGVEVYPAPVPLGGGEVTKAGLDSMVAGDTLERATHALIQVGVELIVFACTSGSLLHGPGWDKHIAQRIEQAGGVPATTTATAITEGLRVVGARRVAIATPYLPEIDAAEQRFLEAAGFTVTAIGGPQLRSDRDIGRLAPDDARSAVAQLDLSEADAIFCSCTNWHLLDAVADLEATHGKPVITSNQATTWFTLRALDVHDPVPGYGQLLHTSTRRPVDRPEHPSTT